MVKPILPILFSSAGVAAAGAAGYFVFVEPNVTEVEPQPVVSELATPETKPEAEPAKEPEAPVDIASIEPEVEEPAEPAPTQVVEPALPEFTILRVDPDGNAVIAGTASADSEIELFDGEISIAKTTTGSTGDFAFVLDTPLAPGLHQLSLLATDANGDQLSSAQAGLVNVPLPDKREELTVLITEPGEASRVLTKATPLPPEEKIEEPEVAALEPETPSVSDVEPVTSKIELGELASDVSKVKVKTATEDVAVSIKNSEVAGLQPSPSPIKPVLIEAAEVEGKDLFIAGSGEPGMSVNIYLDEELLGKATVSENGAFLFEGKKPLSAGRYSIRADMSNAVSGKVVARAEVKLLHEPRVAKVAPQPEQKKKSNTISLLALQGGAKKVVTPKQPDEPEAKTEVTAVTEAPSTEPEEVAQVQDDAPVQEENVIRTGSSVIIRRGDNLWRVARRNYGSGIRYTTIFDANRDQIRNPDLIYPGQVLKVPEGENSEDSSDQG